MNSVVHLLSTHHLTAHSVRAANAGPLINTTFAPACTAASQSIAHFSTATIRDIANRINRFLRTAGGNHDGFAG